MTQKRILRLCFCPQWLGELSQWKACVGLWFEPEVQDGSRQSDLRGKGEIEGGDLVYYKEECVSLDVKKLLFFALFVGMNGKNRGKWKKEVCGEGKRGQRKTCFYALCAMMKRLDFILCSLLPLVTAPAPFWCRHLSGVFLLPIQWHSFKACNSRTYSLMHYLGDCMLKILTTADEDSTPPPPPPPPPSSSIRVTFLASPSIPPLLSSLRSRN